MVVHDDHPYPLSRTAPFIAATVSAWSRQAAGTSLVPISRH